MPDRANVLTRPVAWQRTGARVFTYAAHVDHTWWVLRLNGFPDHPLFTLFVGGEVVGDVEDVKTTAWDLDATHRPHLTDAQREEVLALMRGLGPYGSEVGRPCDGDWCACDLLTDEYVREGPESTMD
ncbi:hypothetical protein ACQPW3_23670 [Actinosynnema sp. CA-248983]